MALAAGSSGPDFALLKGDKNLVVLFFPLAFSGVCTKELCMARDNMKLYDSLDAQVIAISVDSFFTLREFKKSQYLNFYFLATLIEKRPKAYDSLYEDYLGMMGVAKRSAYVLDRQGTIRYAEVLDDFGQIPDLDAIQQGLKTLG